MSEEKKRVEDVNWNIEEVVLSQDGKSIQSISGDMVLTRNKLRAFIDKEMLSEMTGTWSLLLVNTISPEIYWIDRSL